MQVTLTIFDSEMDHHQPRVPLGLALVQRFGAVDDQALRSNQERLRQLKHAHGEEVRIFSAHDPVEFERCVAGE